MEWASRKYWQETARSVEAASLGVCTLKRTTHSSYYLVLSTFTAQYQYQLKHSVCCGIACNALGKTSIKKRLLSGISQMMGGVYPCPNFWSFFDQVIVPKMAIFSQ